MNNYEIEKELAPVLGSGELLTWTGRPGQGVRFSSMDIFLIPFSIIWFCGIIFWEVTAIKSGAPILMMIFGIPFILAGLFFTVGRFIYDVRRRANTIYGISNNRIIIKSGIKRKVINSINIKSISNLSFTQKADGSGTILLGPLDSRFSMMQGTAWPGAKQAPSLESISDVKNVYDKIVELQRA